MCVWDTGIRTEISALRFTRSASSERVSRLALDLLAGLPAVFSLRCLFMATALLSLLFRCFGIGELIAVVGGRRSLCVCQSGGRRSLLLMMSVEGAHRG